MSILFAHFIKNQLIALVVSGALALAALTISQFLAALLSLDTIYNVPAWISLTLLCYAPYFVASLLHLISKIIARN